MSPRRATSSAELIIRFRYVLEPLGEAIAARRKARGMTQQQLADAVASQRAYISALESGTRNPTIITLTKIAEALGCTMSDLLRDAGS
jgi:transcriptional regulator with XRE-family HTH domain